MHVDSCRCAHVCTNTCGQTNVVLHVLSATNTFVKNEVLLDFAVCPIFLPNLVECAKTLCKQKPNLPKNGRRSAHCFVNNAMLQIVVGASSVFLKKKEGVLGSTHFGTNTGCPASIVKASCPTPILRWSRCVENSYNALWSEKGPLVLQCAILLQTSGLSFFKVCPKHSATKPKRLKLKKTLCSRKWNCPVYDAQTSCFGSAGFWASGLCQSG